MSLLISNYIHLNSFVSITMAANTTVDPGDASVVLVTVVDAPAPNPASMIGMLGGIEGRFLIMFNTTANAFNVKGHMDVESSAVALVNRIKGGGDGVAVPSNTGAFFIYLNGIWRFRH